MFGEPIWKMEGERKYFKVRFLEVYECYEVRGGTITA